MLTLEPWREVPPSLAALLEPELPALREEILSVIAAEVPEYARPLEGAFGRGVRLGVDEALGQFARLIADPEQGRGQSREVYRALGRGEMREGRGLDALQAAYRVGARVAWRRLSAVGLREGLAPEILCALADAIFAYIDELSADSVEGFAQAQQAAAGERERRRRRALATLLGEPFDPDVFRAAAADAGFDPGGSLAALACEPGNVDAIARRLSVDALAGVVGEIGCIVVTDPDGPGRRAEIERACGANWAALGPSVPVGRARVSWNRAHLAFTAVTVGALEAEPGVVIADQHLTEVAFFEARSTLTELARQVLAPLDELTPAARERMTETLRAYLDHRGNAAAMAEVLHVHAQTVRYRLKRLRELFGDTLDSPDARFQLETAVRLRI